MHTSLFIKRRLIVFFSACVKVVKMFRMINGKVSSHGLSYILLIILTINQEKKNISLKNILERPEGQRGFFEVNGAE